MQTTFWTHTGQNDHNQKNPETINAGEGVEKKEQSYAIPGKASRYSHYGEQYGGSFKT